jgi:hypothetical protein
MISWRLVVPAVLVAAAIAGCIACFFTPSPPQRVEADQRLPLTLPKVTVRHDTAISTNIQHPSTEDHITAYRRAAEAILKRAENAEASADEPLFAGRVPLPKRRPVPRP